MRRMAARLVLLALLLAVVGCTSSRSTQTEPRQALVFGRFRFYLAPDAVTLREGLDVRIAEFRHDPDAPNEPQPPSRHYWLKTDATGYFELDSADPRYGYRITQVILPRVNSRIDIDSRFTLVPRGQVLNLGTMVCRVNQDGTTNPQILSPSTYDPSDPLVSYALTRHQGDPWRVLLRNRYILQRQESP